MRRTQLGFRPDMGMSRQVWWPLRSERGSAKPKAGRGKLGSLYYFAEGFDDPVDDWLCETAALRFRGFREIAARAK